MMVSALSGTAFAMTFRCCAGRRRERPFLEAPQHLIVKVELPITALSFPDKVVIVFAFVIVAPACFDVELRLMLSHEFERTTVKDAGHLALWQWNPAKLCDALNAFR